MIGRSVAEAGEHHRIVGERQAGASELPGDADRKSGADRLGQVRSDGRGLRRDGQPLRSDDLVPPALHAFGGVEPRSEEQTSELQSLMRISYAGFCLKKKKHTS